MTYSNLTVYSLADCSKCKYVIEFLDGKNLYYKKIECYGDSIDCDKMEDLTNFSRYPVIMLTTKDDKELYLGYSGRVKKEGVSQELSTNAISYTYSSVEKMMEGFLNLIKK